MNRILVALVALFFSIGGNAQENSPVMADAFRNDGKIYVVIAVIAIIFIALVLFMLYLERKLKKIEDQIGKQNK